MADPITLTLLAGGVAAVGTLVGGEMAASGTEKAAELKSGLLGKAAADARATGQRDMFEQQRTARLALSTLRTRAAAGGAGNDTDTIRLTGDIAARGEYQALASLYTGESRASGLMDEAAATKWSAASQANATRVGSYFGAAGNILSGLGSAARIKAGVGTSGTGNPLDITYQNAQAYG